jgi:formylglycine-generating enzyme required for sulfatase activity
LIYLHFLAIGCKEGAKAKKQRLLRGGSWNNNANNCRSANRNHNAASNRNNNIGFRVVAVAPSTPSRQNS